MKVFFDNISIEENLTFVDVEERLKKNRRPISISENGGCRIIDSRTRNEENYRIEFDENNKLKCMKIWPDYREFMEVPEKYDKIYDKQAAEKWVERYLKKNVDKVNICLTQFHRDGVQIIVVVKFNT